MTVFIPGETISHQFFVPFTQGDVSKVYVSYRQNGRIVLVKNVYAGHLTNVTSGVGSSFTVTLSQQESLLFQDDKSFTIEINVISRNGQTRYTSQEMDGETGIQHIREVVN